MLILVMLSILSDQPLSTYAQAQPPTPAPFLYPPFLGTASAANSIFDHTAPLYNAQNPTQQHKITTFNGTVAVCLTDTPVPTEFAPTPGATPTPRCQSGTSYNFISYDGHNGIDYGIRYQPIIAPADVVAVERAGWRSPQNHGLSYGLYIVLRHPNGYWTLYGHLSTVGVQVCSSCSFSRGHMIGISGNTGKSTGAHLHFSVFSGPLATNGADPAVVDPYGWQGPGAPVWANNQVNSLWVQYPHVGANPAILPGGTALAIPTLSSSSATVDDSQAVIVNNPPACSWTEISLGTAQNGQMRRIQPKSTGTNDCTVKWPRPTNLPAGRYRVYVNLPIGFVTPNSDAADGAIYTVGYGVWFEGQPLIQTAQAVVSQSDVLAGSTYLSGKAYIGTYFFLGGSADEYILLGNVITGSVTATTRLVADSVIFERAPGDIHLPLIVVKPIPMSTPTRTPTAIVMRTPTPTINLTNVFFCNLPPNDPRSGLCTPIP